MKISPPLRQAIYEQRTFVFVFCAVIVVFHFILVFRYGSNYPYMDDLDAIVRTATAMAKESSWWNKLDYAFTRHNEHRIVLNKGLDLVQLSFTGKVNIKHQLIVGNLFLLSTFLLIGYFFHRHVAKAWYLFLPAPLLIFNLSSWEAFLWPMVSIQTMGVIFFAFGAIILLFHKQAELKWGNFAGAFAMAAIATYACGNGFLCLIVCFAGLLTQRYGYRYAVVWLLLSVVLLAFYFQGYQPIAEHPKPMDAIMIGTDKLIAHFFILLGSPFALHRAWQFPISVFSGFLIISVFLYSFIPQQLYRKNPVGFFFLSFLILTCALTSLTRSGFGPHQAFAVRYQIYSLLTVLFVYFGAIQLLFGRSVYLKYPFIAFILVACVSYARAYVYNILAVRDLNFSMKHSSYMYHMRNESSFAYPDQGFARRSIEESDAQGVYSYPVASYRDLLSPQKRTRLPERSGSIRSAFDVLEDADFLVIYNGWAFIEGMDYGNFRTDVVLTNDEHTLVFGTHRHSRPDVSNVFQRDLSNSGFTLVADKKDIPDGTYHVGFYIRKFTPFPTSKSAYQYSGRALVKRGAAISLVDDSFRDAPEVDIHTPEAAHSIDVLEAKNDTLTIRGWAVLKGVASRDITIALKAVSRDNRVDIPLQQEVRIDVSNALAGDYDNSGFTGVCGTESMAAGDYDLVLVFSTANASREIPLQSRITIP